MLTSKPLAATSFMSGPEDDLVTADVYEISNDAIINAPQPNDPPNQDPNGMDELRGGPSMAQELPINKDSLLSGGASVLTKAKQVGSVALKAVGGVNGLVKLAGGAKLDGPSILQRLSSGGLNGIPGIPSNSLTSLSSVLSSAKLPLSLTSALTSTIPNNLGSFVNSNNISSKIDAGNIASSYQISTLINNISGSQNHISVVDKDSTARLISGLTAAGTNAGISNTFSSISNLANGDKSILAQAATSALQTIVKTGNVSSVKDIVKAVGPEIVKPLATSLFNTLAKNYHGTTNNTAQPNQDFHDVVDTFSHVDSNWMNVDRFLPDPNNPGQVIHDPWIDMSTIASGNHDFRTMFQQGVVSLPDISANSGLKFMCLANAFPSSSPEMELKKTFPFTLTNLSTSTDPAMDQADDPEQATEDPYSFTEA